jgi:hypothetical protein
VCDRIQRTLVKERDRFFTVATAPSIPASIKHLVDGKSTFSPSNALQQPAIAEMDDSLDENPQSNMDTAYKTTAEGFQVEQFESEFADKKNKTFMMGEGLTTMRNSNEVISQSSYDQHGNNTNFNNIRPEDSLLTSRNEIDTNSLLETLTQRRTLIEQKKIDNLMNHAYTFIQSASAKPPKLTSKAFNLTMQTEKVWNTPYNVVRGPRY